jgi:IclR family acetate operon transcriptional repressor
MERDATSYHSQGLLRALAVLKLLGTTERAVTLAELSTALTLPKSTLIRLLSVLEEQEFVYREGSPPVYTVGHAVLEISESYRRQANTAEVAAPYLKELAHTTGLTANIGALEGRWVLHLHVEEPDRPLRFRSSSGSLDYTYCTGLGKMLLSRLPASRVSEHLPEEPFARFTESTIIGRDDFDAELDRIRQRGYSLDDQERDLGVACIAVPIHAAGDLNVALSVAGPAGELTDACRGRYLPVLQETAAQLGSNRRFIASLVASRGGSTGIGATA